jgi:hypothetical protein
MVPAEEGSDSMIPMLEKFVNQDTALDDSQGEANHDS